MFRWNDIRAFFPRILVAYHLDHIQASVDNGRLDAAQGPRFFGEYDKDARTLSEAARKSGAKTLTTEIFSVEVNESAGFQWLEHAG